MVTKIGFFDSGIGGVTVLKECIRLNPSFKYIYYSDSVNNPYGDKSREELISITSNIVSKLIDMGCYIIVIACNTASAICVDYLRDKYKDICFIAIEPALKLVHDNDINSNTLIMATKGTVDSDRFRKLYSKYDNNHFYLLSCSGLANLIEDGNISAIKNYLESNLASYRGVVSSVVLGCTHYPLIKNEIRDVLGNVTFYDGALGVAQQLRKVILDNNFVGFDEFEIKFLDSSLSKVKEKRFWDILGGDYE